MPSRVRRQRVAVVLAAVVAVAAVGAAIALWPHDSAGRDAAHAADPEIASCLAAVLPDDGACSDLRAEIEAQDPAVLDVVLLVPDSDAGERAADAMTAAAHMWQDGLGSMSGTGRADEPPVIRVSTTRVTPGAAVPPLLDPEIVLIAASADATDDPMPAIDIYESHGLRCGRFDGPFALDAWTRQTGFTSHHQLPEGIYRHTCPSPDGDPSDRLCVAVNATFDPATGGLGPFEELGVVGDELGHCVRSVT